MIINREMRRMIKKKRWNNRKQIIDITLNKIVEINRQLNDLDANNENRTEKKQATILTLIDKKTSLEKTLKKYKYKDYDYTS